MSELPEITKRIKVLVDHFTDGNVAEFVRLTKISSHQVLNRIFSVDKRSGKYPLPSTTILFSIKNNLKDLNSDWLLEGNGDMLKQKKNNIELGDKVLKEKLSEKEVLFVLEALYSHKEQLKEYKLYNLFESDIREDEKNKVLKEIARKRLND